MNKLEVNIDFDSASKEWRKNKRYVGEGYFSYKCRHYSVSKNKYCSKKVVKCGYCRYHALHYHKKGEIY